MSNQDTDNTTANDDQAPALDCPAIRTVCEILETLDDLRVFGGMKYNAETKQMHGRRFLFVEVWRDSNANNTTLGPGNTGWQPGLVQPIVSATARTIDGESVPPYGWVEFDDNNQTDLHILFGLLRALCSDVLPTNDDNACPF